MITLTRPLVIELIAEECVLTHIAALSPPELAPVVNSVKVAHYKQDCGGLSTGESIDAVISPVLDDDESCLAIDSVGERRLAVTEWIRVELISAGRAVFAQDVHWTRLTYAAMSVVNWLGQRNGNASESDASRLWRLTTDLGAQAANLEPASENGGELVLLDDQSQHAVRPVERPLPSGERIGGHEPGDVPVYIRREAFDTMLRYANLAPDDLEIGGALLGRLSRGPDGGLFVEIEEAPLLPTQGQRHAVTFNWQAFGAVRDQLRRSDGLALLGLYHVHPPEFESAFASYQDIWGFQSFFSEPWHIFAVVGRKPELTAFFQYDREGAVRASGFYLTGEPSPVAVGDGKEEQ